MRIQSPSALVIGRVLLAAALVLAWHRPAAAVPLAPGNTRDRHISVTQRNSDLDVEIVFQPRDVSLTAGNGFLAAGLEDCRSTGEAPGHPSLPARFINVLIPDGARVQSVHAQADEVLLASDVLMVPAQPPVAVSTPMPALPAFVPPDPAVYAATAKVPAAIAELAGQHTMRGHTYASVRINPVRYVPASRELYLATRITLRLHCGGSAPRALATGRVADRAFRGALAGIVVNSDMIDAQSAVAAGDLAPTADPRPAGLTDYLIITSSALTSAFQPLADHRAARNDFTTAIVSTETIAASYTGSDLQAKIRACISDYVHTRGTAYVVLGGDDTVVPVRYCYVVCGSPTDMPTDLYYAGLDSTWDENGNGIYGESGTTAGNEGDLVADVYVGRIPIRTAADASAYINKVIQFEFDPIPTNRMLLMGVQIGINASPAYSPYSGTDRPTDVVTDGHPDFASHSPISDAEMWTRRMYRDKIQPYYQPATLGLFFDTLTSWDMIAAGDYPLETMNLRTQLNAGWFHVFMMTHGSYNAWDIENKASYNVSTAAGTSGRMGVIYTGSCRTAYFDGSNEPCFAEAFLRNPQGPVAYFGCSRDNWYFPDEPPADLYSTGGTAMDYARNFYDQFYRLPHTSLGQVFYAHKAVSVGWSGYNGADRWVQFGINYLGDPALLAPGATRTLTVITQGQGTVQLDPPGGAYEHGATVQLTAVPATGGWQFVRWDGDLTGSTTNPESMWMDADKTVTAVFTLLGDVNSDSRVNVKDVLTIADSWLKRRGYSGYNAQADLNNDGWINVTDLHQLNQYWPK